MERDTNTRSINFDNEGRSFLKETAFELNDETLAAIYGAGDAQEGFEKLLKESPFNDLLEALESAVSNH